MHDHLEEESIPLPVEFQERMQALESQVRDLQLSKQRSVTLFHEAPTPALLLNAAGRVEDANAAACGLFGRTPEVLLGKRLDQFLSPTSHGALDVLLKQVSRTSLKQRGEVQLLHSDGALSDLLLDVVSSQQDGKFLYFHMGLTDVTSYKQAHQTLLDGHATLAQQIEGQASIVRALNQELEQTSSTFIQQLHLPVARAMNLLGQLRHVLGEPADEISHPLLKTEQAVQQVTALMASMDRYMQMRSMRVHLRPIDLNRVLREVVKNAQPVMVDRNVQLSQDTLPTVQGDSQALYVILDEYVANALKFTKERELARIRVLVREMASEYHIGVEDNGTGFNMRQKDKLFRLFGRLHSSKEYEGTGVGLVTVRRSCERFGGRVWAEGKTGQGATFWFAWPKTVVLAG
ncbi:sensor histidine kinase [Deinococcus humi]|uniref:histidine kinase n=1 Tax=Deinococcus humi TaxID=662880 RepID=A0A7W8JW97_9DEIO|nr:ATP-binding protein [Deinococcus humi]MBB5363108.1 PAS domain S-box-containing protein [Deinococcus humi]GGO24649.1 hypothetical protein GCM10008949_13780 [Deinococcus humi]